MTGDEPQQGEVQPLDWDSEFFGFPIGRIDVEAIGINAVASAEQEARRLGITCLYTSHDASHSDWPVPLQAMGFRLVDVVMELNHKTSILVDLPPTISTARQATLDDLPAVVDQLDLVTRWSRYAVDARFGFEAAHRMHRAWVERAARGEGGRMLVVAEDDSGITGLSTQISTEDTEPRIDIIASTKPGSGAAQALVAFGLDLFGPGRSWGGPIAARNVASLRFCENMGFRIASSRYIYHRWLDEEAR